MLVNKFVTLENVNHAHILSSKTASAAKAFGSCNATREPLTNIHVELSAMECSTAKCIAATESATPACAENARLPSARSGRVPVVDTLYKSLKLFERSVLTKLPLATLSVTSGLVVELLERTIAVKRSVTKDLVLRAR